jgi:hypothetical protein
MERTLVMERTLLSRPERIRNVFKKHPATILTRAQIMLKCGEGWNIDTKYYSMALSRMVANGEVFSFKLLGRHGYCLSNHDPSVYV